jgi:hypothetical protein
VLAADCAFLAVISLASSLWYVARLGFYSDDWGLFAAFQLSEDRSLPALVRASFLDRPAQGVYSVLVYRVFGLAPLGYHLINAAVLACLSVLLYLALRRLQPSRALAFAAALVYVVLPNYSTDRFWFSAFAAPLSIVFYLVSLLADLDAAGLRGSALALRRAVAITGMMISALLYEVALPFFLLNPLLVWYAGKHRDALPQPVARRETRWRYLLTTGILLIVIAVYKAQTSPRLHAPQGMPALFRSIVTNLFRRGFKDGNYGLNLRAAFNVNFGSDFLRLPATVWWLATTHPLAWLPSTALVFGIVVWSYARRIAPDVDIRRSVAFAVSGVGVFLIGYSMFLTNKAIQITAAGIGNRTSIAAALGVAISVAGLCGAVAGAFHDARRRSSAFAVLLGVFAAGGFFVISTISSFWIDAYAMERSVERDVELHAGTLPGRTTLLLAGICSYNGPAIVFESDWDLSGALRLHYGDRTLSADVLRPGSYKVTDSSIITTLYEGDDEYEFAPTLLLYDFRRKTTRPLTDVAAAQAALAGGRADATCPPGGEGVGTRIF